MQDIFIARQAIYDRRLRVYAYELLYREGLTSNAPEMDGDQATSRLLLNAFAEIGLDRVAGAQRVFLNMTRALLLDLPEIPFEKARLVLEILEDTPIDQTLVTRIAALKQTGYTLALDDFEFEERWLPLLPHIHILKVEVPSLDWERVAGQIARGAGAGERQ